MDIVVISGSKLIPQFRFLSIELPQLLLKLTFNIDKEPKIRHNSMQTLFS